MDLQEEWQRLQKDFFSQSNIKKEEIMKAISQESKSTVSELRKRLQYKLYWIIFFTIALALGMLYFYQNLNLLILLGIFFIYYGLGALFTNRLIKQMDKNIDYSENIKTVLKRNLVIAKKVLKVEETSALLLMPMATVGGVVLSQLMKGRSYLEMISDSRLLLITIGLLLIVAPLGYILGKKMNKSAYGCYLDRLENNVSQLESIT